MQVDDVHDVELEVQVHVDVEVEDRPREAFVPKVGQVAVGVEGHGEVEVVNVPSDLLAVDADRDAIPVVVIEVSSMPGSLHIPSSSPASALCSEVGPCEVASGGSPTSPSRRSAPAAASASAVRPRDLERLLVRCGAAEEDEEAPSSCSASPGGEAKSAASGE